MMFGKNTEKKRFSSISSLHSAAESSTNTFGKVLRGNKAGAGIADTTRGKKSVPKSSRHPRPRAIEPPLLPTEILRCIFELFWDSEPPKKNVQDFRLACKLFNEISLEYIYSDITIRLNEGDEDASAIEGFIKRNRTGLTHVSRLRVAGFPPVRERTGYISLKSPPNYSSRSRKSSQDTLKCLLEALNPDQLTSFAVVGRHIPLRIDTISIPLLLKNQSNLRQLCIPITLFFKHGVNTSEVLEGVTIPRFQSLILTDLQYPRHIADVWTLLQNSADTLTSLALKSPEESDLERFLLHRTNLGLNLGLATTELSLRGLRDLHLEGIPCFDKVIKDCAPNLIDYSNLRMLRLDRCQMADMFLLAECNIYHMPKLKSLQLFETGSSITLNGVLPLLGGMELETLALAIHRWEGSVSWRQIKEHLSGSLKRLWIQHMSSSHGPHTLLDMTGYGPPYVNAFFPSGWPRLEEVAIDTHYVDGSAIILPETVKVCRIIGPRAQGMVRRNRPSASHIEKMINFRSAKGRELNVKVSAVGTLDHPDSGRVICHPFIYKVGYTSGKGKDRVSCPKSVLIDEAMKQVPDNHILWFERTDRPWSDKDGSFWF